MPGEEDAKGIPFWEDLHEVTGAVPPWGLFKLLAENPEIITRVPIPLTFLLVPGDKIEARLCMGHDHKLLIRRSSVRELISFETMAQNLKSCFDVRSSDGQPFVCTIYGEDWKPRFVLSEVFNLFILYLRHSCGEALSSSYGPEEQRQATALFPPNVCCVQAYIPLESQTRYLAVTLRSPIKTLMEVYRKPHLGKGCFPNSTDTLDAIVPQHTGGENDLYQPINKDDPDAQLAVRMEASILCSLRKQCSIKMPGIVCEFVRDIQGDLYLVSIARCSLPHVKMMSSTITPWRPSDKRLARIICTDVPRFSDIRKRPAMTAPRSGTAASRRSNIGGGALSVGGMSQPTSPMIKQVAPLQSMARKRGAPLRISLVVDTEEQNEGPVTAAQTAGPGKQQSRRPAGMNLFINTSAMDNKDDLAFAKRANFFDPDQARRHVPQGQAGSKTDLYGLSELHQALIERAEGLHAEGRFEESIQVLADAEKAAIDAIAQQHPKQAEDTKAHPPNAECFRCGDTVYANLEKSGYAHYEWRSKMSSKEAHETSKRLLEKNKLGVSRRSRRTEQLDNLLQKLEAASYATTPRETYDIETKEAMPTTMCKQCLDEAQKDVRNRALVGGIQKFRNELNVSVIASASKTALAGAPS